MEAIAYEAMTLGELPLIPFTIVGEVLNTIGKVITVDSAEITLELPPWLLTYYKPPVSINCVRTLYI